jgi:hypothetical protein
MTKRIALITAVVAFTIALGVTIAASTDDLTKPKDLTVHEWGTFTTVAAVDGTAAQWLPLGGSSDLPCFVEVYKNLQSKELPRAVGQPLDYAKARTQLLGSVRMETPVLYFYSPRRETVNVRVAFPKGFITEWYPLATVNQTLIGTESLRKPNTGATIAWKNVEVLPPDSKAEFIQGSSRSHYYAARATDANPIRVSASHEKFLFYRGVGNFPAPINVTVTDEGGLRIKHLRGKPSVILFNSHGGRLGYRVVDTSKDEAVLAPPALTGNFDSLRKQLEAVLVSQGLYAKEAAAMVETWRDSWFEEGTRVFYIVPPAMVDTILPLTMEPKAAHVARAFVGRVEVLMPATIKNVAEAIAAKDTKTLETYGRFLGPIADRLPSTPGMRELLNQALATYDRAAAGCSN